MPSLNSRSWQLRGSVIAGIFLAFELVGPYLLRAAEVATDFDRNWPRWRGPAETGVAPHAKPPVEWSETKNVRWKVAVPGEGSASPIVWGDRVFVTSAIDTGKPPAAAEAKAAELAPAAPPGAPPARSSENEWRFAVMALRRSDGSVIWDKTARIERPHEGTHQTGSFAAELGGHRRRDACSPTSARAVSTPTTSTAT